MSKFKIVRMLSVCLHAIAFVGATAIASAKADDLPPDCQASFNVNNASITHFGWLPSSGSPITSMKCTDAEALRENLFINGITDDDLNHALSLPDPIDEAIKKNEEFRQAVAQSGSPSEAKTTMDGLLFLFTKYSAANSCFAVRSKGGTVICGLNWLATFVAGYELVQEANPSEADKQDIFTKLDAEHDQLVNLKTGGGYEKNPFSTAKRLLDETEIGLCQEIKNSCLSK